MAAFFTQVSYCRNNNSNSAKNAFFRHILSATFTVFPSVTVSFKAGVYRKDARWFDIIVVLDKKYKSYICRFLWFSLIYIDLCLLVIHISYIFEFFSSIFSRFICHFYRFIDFRRLRQFLSISNFHQYLSNLLTPSIFVD